MSCDLDQLPIITQGSSKTLTINLTSTLTKRPFDISQATDIHVSFLQTLGGALTKTMTTGVTVLSGPGGSLQVALAQADTALLAVGNGDGSQTVIVDVFIAGEQFTAIFNNSIIVLARPF